MNIPDKVKVGGHYIDVVQTNNCDLIADNEIGKTYLAKNVIYLNSNYPDSRKEEALLHELIHNCFFDIDSTLGQDEKLVERLGVMFYMIIKDNSKIFMVKEGDV